MQTSRRPQRLALQIQQEISTMLFRNVKDRRIGMVTVMGVDLSPDLRHARVYVSCMGTDQEKAGTLEALNHAAGWIRHELGQRIYENVSQDAWNLWVDRLRMLINEYRLMPARKEHGDGLGEVKPQFAFDAAGSVLDGAGGLAGGQAEQADPQLLQLPLLEAC
jgi:ribosome-binding factor A